MFAYIDFPEWINPYVITGLPVRWYGLMYIVAFTCDFLFVRYQCKRGALRKLDFEMTETLFLFVVIGLILGARILSCLLYEGNTFYWTHPWLMFWPFKNGKFTGLPGMSYHGGVIGGVIGGLLFAKKYKFKFFEVSDTLIAGLPLGYTFGRLGNFINGELWGRVTGSSFGMIFPDAPLVSTTYEYARNAADQAGIPYLFGQSVNLPRYPSQLFEAFGEGILIFIILWFVIRPVSEKKQSGSGLITGSYFLMYGIVRFIIEFFREPDTQLGFIFLSFSMGQLLCFLMIIAGGLIVLRALNAPQKVADERKRKT